MTSLFSSLTEFIGRQAEGEGTESPASPRHAEPRPIELKRGSTLKLEHAAGARVRLVDGNAWLSACRWSDRMRVGEATAVGGSGPILIYALEDASLCLEGSVCCRIEIRRRGEVAASASSRNDDQCIDVTDIAAVARWAEILCCSPDALRKAVKAGGPRIGDVKRHLFVALARKPAKTERS